MRRLRPWSTVAMLLVVAPRAWAQAPLSYQFSFPEREHHLMQVEAMFPEVPSGTLQLRMSRSSPGRYAAHDFAKNVFDVRAVDDAGRALTITRPDPHGWDVTGHSGSVRVTYKVFGDRLDGTYLAVDGTHAHINMPAAVMWARGQERRTIQVRFERPAGTSWKVATQLMPGTDSYSFSAPNLQYLMDSPTEFSDFSQRTFTVSDQSRTPVFRFIAHHRGTEAELDALTRDVQSIVREALRVFGEYPPYENNTYTFLADYLPWAGGDAMEHRNSTVLTSTEQIRTARAELLDSISHEFFHGWNVERIRPKSLEPFNLDDVNMSGELWLAEGFTNYYGPLVLKRAGLTNLRAFLQDLGGAIDAVIISPGRTLRTPIEMSQLAPFVDQAVANDRTNFDNTFISYYTWGSVIAMGLDLTLRDRTDGRATLDDFMRALWERYGKPGTRVPGSRSHPARSHGRKRDTRRLHARALGALRQAGHTRAGIRRDSLHLGRCEGVARLVHWRRSVCERVLRALHRRSRRGRFRAAAQTGRHRDAPPHPRPGLGRRSAVARDADRRADCRRRAIRLTGIQSWPRT